MARKRAPPSACAASPASPATRWLRREARHPPRAWSRRARDARREAGDGPLEPDVSAPSQLVDQSDDGADSGRTEWRQDFARRGARRCRSEEHTSELQSLMRISYAVFCLTKKNTKLTRYSH